MHLSRLELQGFKTFAKKTILEFPSPKGENKALTVVVGPNGSGKSNLADAIRWCLGEQSMKHLRGKKSEDVIFSGAEGRGRSGFGEVTLTFDNADKKMGVEFSEVTLTRRLYRDGESEYLLNGKPARLSDIQLLLAQAGVGQRTYSVVGQGMIDHVLTSSPEERKVFFDDATGVRGLQIKRHQSMLKLEKAGQNLMEVELLLGEIEPRLRSLRRQVKRLEARAGLEVELRDKQLSYYGGLKVELDEQLKLASERLKKSQVEVDAKRALLKTGDEELSKMESSVKESSGDNQKLKTAQDAYRQSQQQLGEARKQLFEAERALELAKVRSQSNWSPLPLHEIIRELDEVTNDQTAILASLKSVTDLAQVAELADRADAIFARSKKLRDRLTKPNPEDFKPDPTLLKAIDAGKHGLESAEAGVTKAEKDMEIVSQEATQVKTEVFAVERRLRATQNELNLLESRQNEVKIELARYETRLEGLVTEMRDALGEVPADLPAVRIANTDDLRGQIQNIKHQLELIGTIDEETKREYQETEERYTFLDTQLKDIRAAIESTEKVIDELDGNIREQSEKAFGDINREFQKYFKILFGGGSCGLIKMKEVELKAEASDDQKITLDRAMENMAEEKLESEQVKNRIKDRGEAVAGIDIQATPPGKTMKHLNLLSGGERALTSIALLSAIMATNPSPFVVLDEVDAALDESNTVRFANILRELQKLTQFIVITHNRATMERADMLYGVTMGQDGVSNLLSVSLSDVDEQGNTARR